MKLSRIQDTILQTGNDTFTPIGGAVINVKLDFQTNTVQYSNFDKALNCRIIYSPLQP